MRHGRISRVAWRCTFKLRGEYPLFGRFGYNIVSAKNNLFNYPFSRPVLHLHQKHGFMSASERYSYCYEREKDANH